MIKMSLSHDTWYHVSLGGAGLWLETPRLPITKCQQRGLMIFRCAEAFSIKTYLLKSLSGVLGAAGAAYPCPTP